MAPSSHSAQGKRRRRVLVIGGLVVVLSLAVLVIRSGAVVCTPSGTTTAILQLCKPASGESSWATAINANWDLLDSFFGIGNILKVVNGGTGLSSPGPSGNVLTSNGTAWVSQAAGGAGFMRSVYTSSATYTVPAGVTQLYVQVLGAGGGGGGGGGCGWANPSGASGGPGAHGGYADALITTTPSTNFTVTIGAGGTGGSGGWAAGTSGGSGGTTSFGSNASATGGGGGGGGGPCPDEFTNGSPGANSYHTEGAGTTGDVQVRGNGRGPGQGGPAGPGQPGGSGAAGQSGLVIVWY